MSGLFKLQWIDAVRGLLFTVVGSVLGILITALENGGHIDWKTVGVAALVAGLTFLQHTYFSDSSGKLGGKL